MNARSCAGTMRAMNLPLIKLVVPVAGWATQGQYALVEACVPAGTVIPAHVAQHTDVVLHVLDGALAVVVDGNAASLESGGSATLERGAPRRIEATRDTRVLALIAPAGLEQLLSIVADPSTDPDDRAALLAVGGVQQVPAA
jgi:quercetin dioxygenase-like cupin family protein